MWRPTISSNELYHHGILRQKWGVRRYQNPDGTLTAAGKKRYGAGSVDTIKSAKGLMRRLNDVDQAMAFHKRDAAEGREVARGYQKKKEKEIEKKWTSRKKIQKYNNKVIEGAGKERRAESYIKKGEEEVDQLLKTAQLQGYDIKSKNVQRSVVKGKDVMASIGATTLSALAVAVIHSPVMVYTIPANRAPGTKYKIRENKDQRAAAKEAKREARAEKWDSINEKMRVKSINEAAEAGIAEYKRRQDNSPKEIGNAKGIRRRSSRYPYGSGQNPYEEKKKKQKA